jgi:two-component system response regulator AlgR
MRLLICDDEPLARDRLRRLIGKLQDYEVIGEAKNGLEAVEMTKQQEPDVLLIDIQMPGLDGLEACSHVAKLPNPPAIIFCTAYNDYAVDAFNVNAIAYLLKPVKAEQLAKALDSTQRLNKAQLNMLAKDNTAITGSETPKRSHISAKTHRGIELIDVKVIRYFKADQKYVVIRHSGGAVLVDDALKDFERDLGDAFIRVHRNALVAIEHIEGLEVVSAGHYQVRMRGVDEKLQVSRRHLPQVRKLLNSL